MEQSFAAAFPAQEIRRELTENILPFWINHVKDPKHGGFYGALTNNLRVHNRVPRSAILCARILWTYARAYREFGVARYLEMADYAYGYLCDVFRDQTYGGLYWSVNRRGRPVADRKHHYAQAFGIYGLTEYYLATGRGESLLRAREVFALLEEHARDHINGGYIEGSTRAWGSLKDMRLSHKEINCRKSMNTMLHILEAYSNLLRVWNDARLRQKHGELLTIFQRHIIDKETAHFRLFFDEHWNSLVRDMSPGHDIEGSWLLWEAAELQDGRDLTVQIREDSLRLARAVLRDALEEDGGIRNEINARGQTSPEKAWWVQAEALVGFYNAFQQTGDRGFFYAAVASWGYIKAFLVDRTHGDWYKQLRADRRPDRSVFKAGPWSGPYHHARACFEILTRLAQN